MASTMIALTIADLFDAAGTRVSLSEAEGERIVQRRHPEGRFVSMRNDVVDEAPAVVRRAST